MPNQSINELLDRMSALSDADVSVFIAAVDAAGKGDGAVMQTSAGSKNEAFWRVLAELGWLRVEPQLPIDGAEIFRGFRVQTQNLQDLQKLISEFRSRRQYKIMGEIYETFCVPFSRELLEHVRAKGGDHADVAVLLGLTLARTLSQSVAPSGYDKALQEIEKITKRSLASA